MDAVRPCSHPANAPMRNSSAKMNSSISMIRHALTG